MRIEEALPGDCREKEKATRSKGGEGEQTPMKLFLFNRRLRFLGLAPNDDIKLNFINRKLNFAVYSMMQTAEAKPVMFRFVCSLFVFLIFSYFKHIQDLQLISYSKQTN